MIKQLGIKKFSREAIVPNYATNGSSGMDVYALEDQVLWAGTIAKVDIGLGFDIPQGYEIQVRPKSGLAVKYGVHCILGTVDEDYKGSVAVMLANHSDKDFKIEKHMKIAQIVLAQVDKMNFVEVEELEETDRGSGGFGSTGLF